MLRLAQRILAIALVAAGVAFVHPVPTALAEGASSQAVPVVSSFSPVGGPSGTLVFISGSGFTGATAVRFFNNKLTSFSVSNDAQITATVPSGATTGPISVVTPGGTGTSATNFYVGSAPTVSGLSPGYGPVGTVVTISGSDLTGALSVTFGGIQAVFTVVTSNQISATVPNGAVTGFVTVTNPAGSGTSGSIFYLPPTLTGYSPGGGPVGAQVVIAGSGFGIANGVSFNGVGASFTINTNSQITASVPNGASTGPITVSSPAGSGTSALNFFVGNIPGISSFSPDGGPAGTLVTINGSGFDGIADVAFNGVSAVFVVDNPTQLHATVPPGAISGPITVTNPAGTGTSATNFFVGDMPQITSITPPFGPVGVPVIIVGSGFTGVTQVVFNLTNSPFTIVNDGQITTSIPAGATTGYLRIVNPSGTVLSAQVFGISPAITTFDPSCVASLNRDTTHVVILGNNFTGATSALLNNLPASFVVESDQQVRCTVPTGDVDGPVSIVTPYGTAVSTASFRIIQLQVPPRVAGQRWPRDYNQNVVAAMTPGTQQGLVSVPDGVGGVIEVWQDNRSGDWDIYAQRINIYGAIATGWPVDGLPVCTSPGSQMIPTAVADGAGGVLIAWQDNRTDGGDIYAQHVLNDGTIETTWPANGLAIATAPNQQNAPTIAADRSCGAFIAWQDVRSGQWDIYAQHVTALGAVAQGWAANGSPICSEGSQQDSPSIVADGSEGALVVWTDHRWSNQSFVQRLRADGALVPGWPVNGVSATDYCCYAVYPQITSDGAGGAYVVWQDSRCNWNAFMQHLSSTGTVMPGWSTSGNFINQPCRYGIGEEIRVMPDGAGGAYVCWGERMSYGQSDIMVQRLLPNGQPVSGWPTYGLRLMNDGPDQTSPEMIPDGYGGVIVTWRDSRNGSWDIYAERVMASGAPHPAWTAGGMRVSTPSSDQLEPTIVPASNGAAIVSWRDNRTDGYYRAYAQLLDGSGRLSDPTPELTKVADVPADQGGNVRIKWNSSYLDTLPTLEIGNYGIWRQVTAAAAAAAAKAGARLVHSEATADDARPGVYRDLHSANGTTYWEGIGSILARGYATYTYVAPTLVDSTAAGNPFSTYMVDAHAAFFPYYWTSWEDSGYSVDNLPPGQPHGFAATMSGQGVRTSWTPSTERDLAGYRLYRGVASNFDPGPASLVATTTDTAYTDAAGTAGAYYKLLAVDIHGNASDAALIQAGSFTGGYGPYIPTVLSLGPPAPNPVHGRCGFRLGIPTRQTVTLRIYDATGRSIRRLLDGVVEPGEMELNWDGRDDRGQEVASGIYLYQLNAEHRTMTRRMVVIR